MVSFATTLLVAAVAVQASVLPRAVDGTTFSVKAQENDWFPGYNADKASLPPTGLAKITGELGDRVGDIKKKQKIWQYAGDITNPKSSLFNKPTPFYPGGEGLKATEFERDQLYKYMDYWYSNVDKETKAAGVAMASAGYADPETGKIAKLEDYKQLYHLKKGGSTTQHFSKTMPDGPFKGIVENFDHDTLGDLTFAMERLSVAPFSIRRVEDKEDWNGFTVKAEDVTAVVGRASSLEELTASKKLYIADHKDQGSQTSNPGGLPKYGAASQAYFYVDAEDQFRPLAIKSNVPGAKPDFYYTPKDSKNDWLLAKMMFNQNDFWFTQWYHLAACHETPEIVYLAAIRTLSEQHPLMVVLRHMNKLTFAMRHAAKDRLLNKNGPIDAFFPWEGGKAGEYTSDLYHTTSEQNGNRFIPASNFQKLYLKENLKTRGVDGIKYFPYRDDANKITEAIRKFMTTFVESYYADEAAVKKDEELQEWINEANTNADVKDFPKQVETREGVIDIMTHMAYLVTVMHGVLNTNSPAASTATLPMHPVAFYKKLPTEKGVEDVAEYLPGLKASLGQIGLLLSFTRPEMAKKDGNPETIYYMFSNEEMLRRLNEETRQASKVFQKKLDPLVTEVENRKIKQTDGIGMVAQNNMPFVWPALHPKKAAGWSAI